MRHLRVLPGWPPLAVLMLLPVLVTLGGCAVKLVPPAGSSAAPPSSLAPHPAPVTASPAQIFQDVPQSP